MLTTASTYDSHRDARYRASPNGADAATISIKPAGDGRRIRIAPESWTLDGIPFTKPSRPRSSTLPLSVPRGGYALLNTHYSLLH